MKRIMKLRQHVIKNMIFYENKKNENSQKRTFRGNHKKENKRKRERLRN